MWYLLLLVSIAQAQQDLCHGYTQKLPITITPQKTPDATVNTICFKSKGVDTDAVYWLLIHNMYENKQVKTGIYIDKVAVKLNSQFEPLKQFSMGRPIYKAFINSRESFQQFNMECATDLDDHKNTFAVFEADNFQITFAFLDAQNDVSQKTHALTNIKLENIDYFSDSDFYVSGVYKGGTMYICLTLMAMKTEDSFTLTPALLAWNKDGTIKHFISFGRKDGIFDVANDMILNPKGDNLYVATTFYKAYVKDGVEGEGLYPVISRYNIDTGEQQYQYEENIDAMQEYIFMALSDNGSKVLICTECQMGYEIEIIYASMSIFNNFIPEHQYYDFYERVDRIESRRRLRSDTSLFDLIQSKTNNALSNQDNSRPFRCTGAFISGNGQKGGMLYMKNDWENHSVQHKTLFSTDLSQMQMYEQIIEYKNHDSLYFVVPKSGIYNFRENYFTFALSQQFTKLNFGQKTYSTVIMNTKQVNQDNCSILTNSLVYTAERQFTNEKWMKAEIYQESSLEPSAKVQFLLATNIFSGEFSQQNLAANDLSFDVSSKYPLKFLSMCYEGVVPEPPDSPPPSKLSLSEAYVDHEIWSNESKTYSHLALEGKCGAPRDGVTYSAIISPTDPCATYDQLTFTATFANCPPNSYALTFKATLAPSQPVTSDFFIITVKKFIVNEAPVFVSTPDLLLVCGNEVDAVCFNKVKVTDPNVGDSQMLEYEVKIITQPSIKKTDLTDHAKALGFFENSSSTATTEVLLSFQDDPIQQKIDVTFKYTLGMQHSKSEFFIVRVQFRDTFRPSDVKKTEIRYFYLFYFPKENVDAAFLKPDNSNYLPNEVIYTNNKQPIGVPFTLDIPAFREKNIKSLIYSVAIEIDDLNDPTIPGIQLYNSIQNVTISDSYNKQGDAIYTSFVDIKGLKFTIDGSLPVGKYRFYAIMKTKSHSYLQSPSQGQLLFLSKVVYDIKIVSDNSPPFFKTQFLDYVFDTYKGDLWNVTIPQFRDPNLNDKLFIKFEGLPLNQSINIIEKQAAIEGAPEVQLESLNIADFVELNINKTYLLQFKTSNETALQKYQIRAILKDNDSVKEGVIESTSDNFTVQFMRKVPKPPKNDTEVVIPRNDTQKVISNYTEYQKCREGEFPSFTAVKYNEVVSIESKIYSEQFMQFECSTYFFLFKIELPENGSKKIFNELYRSLRVDPREDKSLIGNYKIDAYIYNELDAKKESTLFDTFYVQVYHGDKQSQSLDGIDLPKGKDYKDIVKIGEVSQALKFELEFKQPVEFVRKDENKEFKEYRKLQEGGFLNVTIDVWLESQSAQTFESANAFSGYNVSQKSPEKLEVTIDSGALLKLSQSLQLDFIIVEITNNEFDPWTNLDTFKTLILRSQIPRVTLGHEAGALVAFSAVLVVVLLAAFGLNLVYNLLVARERVTLAVYLFLSLQYICSFQDLQIVLPRNLKLILAGLTRFTYLRPFPLSLGGFSDDQVMLSETGTGPNLLQNNGILIIILIIVFAISFLPMLTKKVKIKLVQQIKGAFLVISYLILTTSSLRNLFFFGSSSGSQSISAIVSIFIAFIFVSLPFLLFLVYANELYGFNIRFINFLQTLKKLVFLNDIQEKNKFEAQQMLFACFIYHRLIYLMCREAFYSSPSILLGIAALNQAIMAARVLKHQPYSDELVTKLTIIISEVILLIMLYFVSSFSEGQPSQKIRYETAKAFIFLLYIYMSIAVLALVSDSVLKKKLRQKMKIVFEILPQGRRDQDYEISNELDIIKPQTQIHSSSKIELQKKQTQKEEQSSESEIEEEAEEEQKERFKADRLFTRSQQKIPTKVGNTKGQTLVFPQSLMRAASIKKNDPKGVGKLFDESAIEEQKQDNDNLERVSVDTSEYPESYGGPYQKPTKKPKSNSDEDSGSQDDQESGSQKSSEIEKSNRVSYKMQKDGVFNPQSDSENQSENNSDDGESQDKENEENQSSKSNDQYSSSQQEESKQVTSQKSETEQTSQAVEQTSEAAEQTSEAAEQTSEAAGQSEASSSKQETSQQVQESSSQDSNQAKTESSEESN